jgi:predicted alpha-1,6-mannanase (GH76 family)
MVGKLLKPDKYKQIVIDSLAFLVKDNRVKVDGFVVMTNYQSHTSTLGEKSSECRFVFEEGNRAKAKLYTQ